MATTNNTTNIAEADVDANEAAANAAIALKDAVNKSTDATLAGCY